MDKVGFAVAGCGSIAVKHFAAISQVASAQLKAVYDTNLEKARQLAKQYGVAYAETFSELLKRDDIQVVDICAPSAFHAELAKAAARAGNMY